MEISKQTARKLYPDVPKWFKDELKKVFGEKSLKEDSYEDIKTFEDACLTLELNPDQVLVGAQSLDELAYRKLKVIIKAINQGWEPDWDNSNQAKWYPYFLLSSGFGFSASYCYYDRTATGVGSRLCFESEIKAGYAGRQFEALYKDFLK